MDYTDEFEELWAIRPPRKPNNPKPSAFKAFRARLREKHTVETIRAGIERYKAYCEAEGILGTKFTMMFSTFLGPDLHFLENWECDQTPEWASLPRMNEELEAFARLHQLPKPGRGESYPQYRKKLQDEIERRLQNG